MSYIYTGILKKICTTLKKNREPEIWIKYLACIDIAFCTPVPVYVTLKLSESFGCKSLSMIFFLLVSLLARIWIDWLKNKDPESLLG